MLYTIKLSDSKAYLFSALFVLGNIVLPQLCHFIPSGGPTLLPIYFFTLIAAYKYGWQVGLLTAVASPIVNHALFGMPSATMLPVLLFKSAVLALSASFIAHRFRKVSILLLLAVVLSYQIIGTLFEWPIMGSLTVALQDFRIGVPGMLIQIFGGFLFLKYLNKA